MNKTIVKEIPLYNRGKNLVIRSPFDWIDEDQFSELANNIQCHYILEAISTELVEVEYGVYKNNLKFEFRATDGPKIVIWEENTWRGRLKKLWNRLTGWTRHERTTSPQKRTGSQSQGSHS